MTYPEGETGMTWQEEFKRRIADYITRNGIPVDNTSGRSQYYGYIARDWERLSNHLKECGLNYPECSYEDAYWTEFAGTFAESDNERHGLEATVTCTCRQIAGRKWRLAFGYGEGYASMLREITKEPS